MFAAFVFAQARRPQAPTKSADLAQMPAGMPAMQVWCDENLADTNFFCTNGVPYHQTLASEGLVIRWRCKRCALKIVFGPRFPSSTPPTARCSSSIRLPKGLLAPCLFADPDGVLDCSTCKDHVTAVGRLMLHIGPEVGT